MNSYSSNEVLPGSQGSDKDLDDLGLYGEVLKEIRYRGELVEEILSKPISRIELVTAATQLRVCLELIAMGALVNNRSEVQEVATAFHRRGAESALKIVKRVNPNFWPGQLERENDYDSEIRKFGAPGEPILQESEWSKDWGRLSALVHAQNPYGVTASHRPDWLAPSIETVSEVFEKTMNLLEVHIVVMPNREAGVLGEMRSKGNGGFVCVSGLKNA